MSGIKYATIAATASGETTPVEAVDGKIIRVHTYTFVASAAVGVQFLDGSGGTSLTGGAMPIAANGGVSTSEAEHGHFQTTRGSALVFDIDATANVYGHLTYSLA